MTRSFRRFGALLAVLFVAGSVLLVPAARAQQDSTLAFSAGLNGGGAFYGRFLEQRAGGRERELTSAAGLALGVALGVRLFQRNVVRLSLDYLPGQFEYRDDTGDGGAALDAGTPADLRLFAVSVEAERTFFRLGRFEPYASVGLTGGWWSLDEGGGLTAGGGAGALFRWGRTSGIGTHVRLTTALFLNLEANALAMGNPFDGADAFHVADDAAGNATFDEPASVRILRARAGLRYLF